MTARTDLKNARVLYVITCAAPPARDVGKIVKLAQDDGWDVCVIATPQAVKFLDAPAVEKMTGRPVRSEYKQPGAPDVLPPPDVYELPEPGTGSRYLSKFPWHLALEAVTV
jgi:hypothetical protein